jgi:hypothetical protein
MLAASVIGLGILASQELGKGGNEFLGLPADANNNDRSAEIVAPLAEPQNGQEAGEAFSDAAGPRSAMARTTGSRRPDHTAAAAGKVAGQSAMGAVRDGAAAEAPRTAASIGNTLAAEFKSHGGAWIASAHAAGERAMEGVAQGIFDARQKVVDAFDTLKELLKHPLGTLQEQARLAGELTGKLLAKGLHSNDEGIRDFSRSTKQYALDQLTALAAKSGHIGAKASAAIENGLKSKNATIRKNSTGREARLPPASSSTSSAAGS